MADLGCIRNQFPYKGTALFCLKKIVGLGTCLHKVAAADGTGSTLILDDIKFSISNNAGLDSLHKAVKILSNSFNTRKVFRLFCANPEDIVGTAVKNKGTVFLPVFFQTGFGKADQFLFSFFVHKEILLSIKVECQLHDI